MANFYGARIGRNPQEIVFSRPGISFTELKAVNGKHTQATLSIAADCPLGIHPIRVRTATGITRVRTFHVGALPEIAETEPNNEFSQPQAVELDVTIRGKIKSEDVDYFIVEAKQGERITAEIEGLRLGRTFFDPHLAILDAQRFELAAADDTALVRQDSVVSIVAPADGRYVVSVRESAFGGNDACTYRLHLGRFPRPLAVFPAGGRPGEALNVSWRGDVAGERNEQIALPSDGPTQTGLFCQDEHGIAPSPNVVRFNELENTLEVEPNDQVKKATPATVPGALNGVIQQPGDVDHFRFSAKKGQVLDVQVFARRLRSPLDPLIRVRHIDNKNKQIAANDDNLGKPDSYVRFTAPADGQYDLVLHDHLRAGGPAYTYRVEIAPPRAQVELSLAERRRWEATKIEIPRGNRTAVMVKAARRDFGGPLDVTLENLPEGVALETVTMPAGRGAVPMIFSASADAPLAAALSEVIARPTAEGKTIASSFKQQTWLVTGSNRREVWSHYADRPAVAVVEQVPFNIAIVQPNVPLVQGGSMHLKVVAERDEGFISPIAVRMLYNPPGVSSSRSIRIAEGQTEATIPLNANHKAPPRTWDVCVEAEANVQGRVLVASPLAKLEIKPAYVALAFAKQQVELGQGVDYPIGVKIETPFEGSSQVALRGLPAGVTADPVAMTKDSTELLFRVHTTEKSPPGRHKTLLCQFSLTEAGEPIAHSLGTGELRIDKPLPKKPPEETPAEEKP